MTSIISPNISVVMFDLGGVVFNSPIKGLLSYGKNNNLMKSAININKFMGSSETYKCLERGEISINEFFIKLEQEMKNYSFPNDFTPKKIFSIILSSLIIRSSMIDIIHILKRKGYRVIALTNNWKPEKTNKENNFNSLGLYSLFDTVYESSYLGMRKPEERIYKYVIKQLQVLPENILFLDDLGINLKAAKQLGISTIKVPFTNNGVNLAINELLNTLNITLPTKIIHSSIISFFIEEWILVWNTNNIHRICDLFSYDAFYKDDIVFNGLLGKDNITNYLIKHQDICSIKKNINSVKSLKISPFGFILTKMINNTNNIEYIETFIIDKHQNNITRYELIYNTEIKSSL